MRMHTCVGVCAFVYVCVRIRHICGDQRTALGVDIMVPVLLLVMYMCACLFIGMCA